MKIVRRLPSRRSGWQSGKQGEFRSLTVPQITCANPTHLPLTIQPHCHAPVIQWREFSYSWQQEWLPFRVLWYIRETPILNSSEHGSSSHSVRLTTHHHIMWKRPFLCLRLKFPDLWKNSVGFCATPFQVCSWNLYAPKAASHRMWGLQHQQIRHSACFSQAPDGDSQGQNCLWN